MKTDQNKLNNLVSDFFDRLSTVNLLETSKTIIITCLITSLVISIISCIDKLHFYGNSFTDIDVIQQVCFTIYSLSIIGIVVAIAEILLIVIFVYLIKSIFNFINYKERNNYQVFCYYMILLVSIFIILTIYISNETFGIQAFKVMILTLTYNVSMFASVIGVFALLICFYKKYKSVDIAKRKLFLGLVLFTAFLSIALIVFIIYELVLSREILNFGFLFNKIVFLFENFIPGFYLLLLIVLNIILISLGYIAMQLPVSEKKTSGVVNNLVEIIVILVIFGFLYFLSNNYLPNQLFIKFLPTMAVLLFSLITFFLMQAITYKLYMILKHGYFRSCPLKKSIIIVLILYAITSLVGILGIQKNEALKAFNYRYCIYQKIFLCWSFLFDIKDNNLIQTTKIAYNRILDSNVLLEKLEGNRPNIILITIDALRADCSEDMIKKEGSALNNLSKGALQFTNYYSNATYTLASMSSLFASKHFASMADSEYITLAEILNKLGYYTSKFDALDPEKYDYITKKDIKQPSLLLKGFKNSVKTSGLKESKSLDERQVESAVEFISNYDNDQPFFLWIHLQELHETKISIILQPPEEVKMNYKHRLRYQDAYLKALFTTLKSKMIYDDTLIILTSDHGEAFKEHGDYYHLFNLYQEMVRVPLLIKLPQQKSSREINTLLSHINLIPGILDYIEFPYKDLNFDGDSFIDLLNKENQNRKGVYLSLYLYKTKDNFSYNIYGKENYYDKRLIELAKIDKDGKWKFIYNDYFGFKELYNLKKDPLERKNLINKAPRKAREMLKDLIDFKSQTDQYL